MVKYRSYCVLYLGNISGWVPRKIPHELVLFPLKLTSSIISHSPCTASDGPVISRLLTQILEREDTVRYIRDK